MVKHQFSSGNWGCFTSPPRYNTTTGATQARRGTLTPISKGQLALGNDPGARLVKAEDFDTSTWAKALARTVASTVCDTVQPQQLGVGASGGVEIIVLGLKLWFEQQVADGVTAVADSVDLEYAHNFYSRTNFMEALKAAATKTPALWPIVVAWHAMTFQKNPIYIQSLPSVKHPRF